jgi:hypothetical protein
VTTEGSGSTTETNPEAASADRERYLRQRISETGDQIDSDKALTGSALGGCVFTALLAALAIYDLMTGKAGVWQAIGVSPGMLLLVAWLMGSISLLLLGLGPLRLKRRDRRRELLLVQLEEELADLLEQRQ